MADKKITLRLKSDPTVVLPEATLASELSLSYEVRWGEAPINAFRKEHWEPVPPPYVLPTGIGAVVQDPTGRVWVRLGLENPAALRWNSVGDVETDENMLLRGPLTTLSEGVVL